MANAELRVRHNLLYPTSPEKLPFSLVPAAVFADPQVASVGATEQELKQRDQRYVSTITPYADTAYGWALENATSFVKILADPDSGMILWGTHRWHPSVDPHPATTSGHVPRQHRR